MIWFGKPLRGARRDAFSLLRKPVQGRELVDRIRLLVARRMDAGR